VPLPGDLRIRGLKGGTATLERALCAWELRQSLPEFEARPEDEQDWLLAVYRTRTKLDRVKAIDARDRSNLT
jgi:hypothetical protein